MNEFIKKNLTLLLAFALPVILILVIAVSAHFPTKTITSNYNFVYAVCANAINSPYYNCNTYIVNRYSVIDNKLVLNPIDPAQDADKNGIPDIKENYSAHLFLHDTKTNQSHEITLADAQQLKFSNLLTSPEGVAVAGSYDRGADFFPFFGGGSGYAYYLIKGNDRSKLNLFNSDNQYYDTGNFQFIGWVTP